MFHMHIKISQVILFLYHLTFVLDRVAEMNKLTIYYNAIYRRMSYSVLLYNDVACIPKYNNVESILNCSNVAI